MSIRFPHLYRKGDMCVSTDAVKQQQKQEEKRSRPRQFTAGVKAFIMLIRSRVQALLRKSKNLSTSSNPVKEQDISELNSAIQWLTSAMNCPAPGVQSRIAFKHSCARVSVQATCTSSPLSTDQLLAASTKLLSSNSLMRCPSSLPPLLVEYSSPNIAKPLHMGHLRSTITGSYVRNIAEYAGHDVNSVCFLGDWGRQFGMLHAGVLHEMNTSGSTEFSKFVESLHLTALLRIYVSATARASEDATFMSTALALSADLEESFGQPNNSNLLWSHTRSTTLSHLSSCYSDLGVRFDEFEGESEYSRDTDHTRKALNLLESLNLSRKHEDGSVRVTAGPNECILLKRDNSSVYLLRDIACALHRHSKHPGRNTVYVVDIGQATHFINLFTILDSIVPQSADKQDKLPFSSSHSHVSFGKVSGMSTRSGNFVLLSDVIEQGTNLMHESRRASKNARRIDDMSVSKTLAVSGLIVTALKVRRNREYAFSWANALASKGETGVALQYTFARLSSLMTRVDRPVAHDSVNKHVSVLLKQSDASVMNLLVCLMNFEDTFWRSYLSVEPCVLVAYSFHLTDKISKCLKSVKVLTEPDRDLSDAYLWVFNASKQTLENCFRVIGLKPVPEL